MAVEGRYHQGKGSYLGRLYLYRFGARSAVRGGSLSRKVRKTLHLFSAGCLIRERI